MARVSLEEAKKELLKNKEVAEQYEELAPLYDFIDHWLEVRKKCGLTQAELAERMNTRQANISRLESGKQPPSWETIMRFAKATGTQPIISFE